MGFDLHVSVSAVTVFIQGILSFFSPCVFPLIPLYIGYLSGGTVTYTESGEAVYDRKKVLLHTVCFVLGISFAFFLLGLGFSAIGSFFREKQTWIAGIGGIIVVLFGLYQLGLFGTSEFLSKDRRLPLQTGKAVMSPVTALIMGFTFSFAWTPCVGPALASVLLMTASADSRAAGFWLIGLYTLGFVLPFLLVGFFTTGLLSLFRKHRNAVKYTVRIGGALMVLMGIMMITGQMNRVTGYLAGLPGNSTAGTLTSGETDETEVITEQEEYVTEADERISEEYPITADDSETEAVAPVESISETEAVTPAEDITETETAAVQKIPAIDFTLTDQYGNVHSLADYKGKTIFLNFWATWCPPCRSEMPDIQKLYEQYDTEGEDAVVILGAASPNYGQEGSEEEIAAFLEQNGYTYPVLMDSSAELFTRYGIYSLPTTFMIDRDGNVFGYITGQLSEDIMVDIIEQTRTGIRNS